MSSASRFAFPVQRNASDKAPEKIREQGLALCSAAQRVVKNSGRLTAGVAITELLACSSMPESLANSRRQRTVSGATVRLETLTVSSELFWPFGRAYRRLGGPTDIPEFTKVAENSADATVRIPWPLAMRTLELAISRTGRLDFGLLAAGEVQSTDLGVFVRAAQSSRTLGDALALVERYFILLTDGLTLALIRQEPEAIIMIHRESLIEASSAVVAFVLAALLKLIRYITRAGLYPSRTTFRHASPPDDSAYRQFFGETVEFGARQDAFFLPAQLLSSRLAQCDEVEAKVFEGVLQRRLSALPPRRLAERVEELLEQSLSRGTPNVDNIAKQLGMSARQLHRRLQQDDTTYRQVLGQLRERLARQHLEEGKLSVSEIAERLGFSSIHAFHRAFKRLTGDTPSSVRSKKPDSLLTLVPNP